MMNFVRHLFKKILILHEEKISMTKIIQSLTVFLLKAFARLPFRVIYLISDFLYLIVFYVAGYRREVVYTNLKNSFPEKDTKEIDRIAHRYYHHLCDLLVESVKFYRMSDKDLDERLLVKGINEANAYMAQGKSYILLGMHYNNWEWSSSMQRISKQQVLIVFNPMRDDPVTERYMSDMRERFGAKTVSMDHSARTVLQFNKTGRPTCLFLAADQSPSKNSHFWTTFLNQETSFFSGPEKIAIKTNQPVFLHYTRKLARGKYEVNMVELFPEPARVDPDTILLTYAEKMEEIIREQPEYWLWSHRRWKHKRPEGVSLVPRQ